MWFITLLSLAYAAPPSGIFGMTQSQTTGQLQLVQVDVVKGTMTPVGQPIGSEAQAQALATMDEVNGIYYILGWDGVAPNIMGVDISSGKVVSSAEIPAFAESAFVGVGEGIDWEPDTKQIVCAGQDNTTSWSIGLVDPKTGDFDLKAYINNSDGSYDPVLGSPSVYTVDQQDFVMMLGVINPPDINFVAANLPTGKFRLFPFCGDLETTQYDPVSKSIIGIGLTIDPSQPGGAMRTLVQMKSDASDCSVVGNVTDYWIILMGVSALDVEHGVLYAFLWPCKHKLDPGCQGSGAVDLIGVDIHTGKVVSVAEKMCVMGECPWSLEWSSGGKSYTSPRRSTVRNALRGAPTHPEARKMQQKFRSSVPRMRPRRK